MGSVVIGHMKSFTTTWKLAQPFLTRDINIQCYYYDLDIGYKYTTLYDYNMCLNGSPELSYGRDFCLCTDDPYTSYLMLEEYYGISLAIQKLYLNSKKRWQRGYI